MIRIMLKKLSYNQKTHTELFILIDKLKLLK